MNDERGFLLVVRTEPSRYDVFVRTLPAPQPPATPQIGSDDLATANRQAVDELFTAALGALTPIEAGRDGVQLGAAPATTAALLPSEATVLAARARGGTDETWTVVRTDSAAALTAFADGARRAGYRQIPEFLAGGFRNEHDRAVGFCADAAWVTETLIGDPIDASRTYVDVLRATGTIAGNVCPGIFATPGAIIPPIASDAVLHIEHAVYAFKPYDGDATIPPREQHAMTWARIRYNGPRTALAARIADRLRGAGWTTTAVDPVHERQTFRVPSPYGGRGLLIVAKTAPSMYDAFIRVLPP